MKTQSLFDILRQWASKRANIPINLIADVIPRNDIDFPNVQFWVAELTDGMTVLFH